MPHNVTRGEVIEVDLWHRFQKPFRIRKAGSQANMLKVVDYLVEKERAAMGS